MTDSSIETRSGGRAFDLNSSGEDFFGEPTDESLEDEHADEIDDEPPADRASDGESATDQTAADVFDQLRESAENDADGVLEDESPEDIIASADDPAPEPEIDEALSVDDDELAALLLTGRTKADEFLWVETDEERERESDSELVTQKPTDSQESDSEMDADTDDVPVDPDEDTSPEEPDISAEETADEDSVEPSDDPSPPTESETDDPETADTNDQSEIETTESSGLFARLRAKLRSLF